MFSLLQKMSLSKKIILNALFVITMFSLTLSVQYVVSYNKQKNMLQDVFVSYSNSLGEMINTQFIERYGDIQAFASNMVFQGFSPKMVTDTLNSYIKAYGTYDLILFVNLEGKPMGSSDRTADGKLLNTAPLFEKNYANEKWFQDVLKSNFLVSKELGLSGTVFENPHYDSVKEVLFKNNSFGSSFSAPVFNFDGQIVGVLTARANMKWIRTGLLTTYRALEKRGYNKSELTILDHQGVVLSEYDPSLLGKDKGFTESPEVIGKLNLVQSKVLAAMEVSQGKTGTLLSQHARKKIEQVSGFSPVWGGDLGTSLGWGVLTRSSSSEVFSEIEFARNAFFISIAVCFIFSLFIFLIFSRSVTTSLTKVTQSISEMGNSLIHSSDELTVASEAVASESSVSASSLEEISASMEELSSMVKHNSSQAQLAAEKSSQSTTAARSGESQISDLTLAMREIFEGSQKIAEIISVVDDIAFQTNLLALNAAVEAARAGEQGRGFAVVADAVRSLAQKSAEASRDITNLIRESLSKTQTGVRLADETGGAFRSVIESIKNLSQMVEEISTSSTEQSNGLTQVSTGVHQLDSSTQKNAATSEELSANARQLQQQAIQLGQSANELNKLIYGLSEKNFKNESTDSSSEEKIDQVNQKFAA